MLDHLTERIETFSLEIETREEFVRYIDNDPDAPAYRGIICIPMATALVHIYSEGGLAG